MMYSININFDVGCEILQDKHNRWSWNNTWRIFTYKELHTATNGFSEDNKLGEGGFGSVYWGRTSDGLQIAVKKLKAMNSKAEMEFAVEVEVLGRVRHKNLLGLRGYCAIVLALINGS
ncbi:hypothetical protein POTOM_023586 [Populus tomentosa]|uniref:Protein kinase domain-containing protein n=1 Tax=Populus tomentosa TaxID=118781 RepID=A0A8X8D124_POPTO|nr:hypothetical protein POTOM_023586 [Populus tomentosa]